MGRTNACSLVDWSMFLLPRGGTGRSPCLSYTPAWCPAQCSKQPKTRHLVSQPGSGPAKWLIRQSHKSQKKIPGKSRTMLKGLMVFHHTPPSHRSPRLLFAPNAPHLEILHSPAQHREAVQVGVGHLAALVLQQHHASLHHDQTAVHLSTLPQRGFQIGF